MKETRSERRNNQVQRPPISILIVVRIVVTFSVILVHRRVKPRLTHATTRLAEMHCTGIMLYPNPLIPSSGLWDRL